MANYKVLIKPSAVKDIEAIPKTDRIRIVAKITELASDPRPYGCQKLSGSERYRIRRGNYRILYSIDDDQIVIVVVGVGHRKDIYK